MRLYLHEPTVVFAARANQASFQFPISEVKYTNVTTGTYTDIGNSMTLLFGSTAGGSDLGMSRIRLDATTDTLYFGLSPQGVRIGECDPADNCYLTVINELRVWSKPSYIDDDGTVYMDGITYVNQNVQSNPVANAGPPAAGEVDSGTGVLTVDFTAEDSFATADGATITDYLWDVAGATIVTGDVDTEEITVEFEPGFYYVKLRVTDSSSKQHTAYVPILAIDPEDDPTVQAFQITRHVVAINGQEVDVRLLENVSAVDFPDGGLVMIIDGNPYDAIDRDNVLFWGWVDTEDASISSGEKALLKDTVLHCFDVAGRMRQIPGFSQVLSHASSPTKWAEMNQPTMDKFIYWLLYHQSTALALADFTWSGTGSTYAFPEQIGDGSNLWDQVDRKCMAMIPDRRLTCNRLGQIRVLPDPMIAETGDRTVGVQGAIETTDYSSISFEQTRRPRYWRVEGQAIKASNTEVAAYFCFAPGKSQGQGEQSQVLGENLAPSQDALNKATGHHYARLNAPQGMFSVTLAGSGNLSFDPARMDWVALTISAGVAAQRGLAFDEARFLLHQLDIRYNYSRGGMTRTNTLRLERETSGTPATTYIPPDADPVDTGDFVPDDTAPTPPGFDGGLPSGQDVVGFIDRDGRIWACPDFTSPGEPTWSRNTAAATAASLTTGSLRGFIISPFSPGYRGTPSGSIDGFAISGTTIYKVSDLFGIPAYTSLHSLTTAASLSAELSQISCSFGRYQATESDNPWVMACYHADSGVGPMRVYVVYSLDGGATWSSEIDVSGNTRTQVKREWSRPAIWMSPRTPGYAIVGCWATTGTTPDGALFYTTDWGATWAAVTDVDDQGVDMGLGFSLHVPWPDNSDERIAYYGAFNETSNVFNYGLWRSVAGTATDISPVDGGKKYGPVRNQFGVRSLDSNRQYMLLAGAADNVDDVALLDAGSTGVTALWKSADWGETWTRVTADAPTENTDDCILQAAFSADNEQIFYAYGNHGYLLYTEDGGATMVDKSPTTNISTNEILAIFGGPTS